MSIIFDALKKLDVERDVQKKSQNPEESKETKSSPFAFISDTSILPQPRISRSLREKAKPSDKATKSEYKYTQLNSTIPAALKSTEEKRYQKIIIALCGATCVVLLFSIGYLFYMSQSQASRSAAVVPAAENKIVVAKKKSIDPIDLQGIMAMDDRRVALINDEIYEVGQFVKGRKIISISVDSIQISNRGKIRTLYVKQKK